VNEKNKSSQLFLSAFSVIWILLFLTFNFLATKVETIDKSVSTFFSATVLTLLSILIVYGFSRLAVSRQKYLLMGAISLIIVFFAATPFVKRSNFINKSGAIPGQSIFYVLQTQTPALNETSVLMPLRNAVFKKNTDFISNLLPENTMLIILLSLAQLGMASGIGLWIAEGIDDITHLIPVALIATIADIWSVSAGATAKIVVSSSINYFLLRFPVLGTDTIPFLIGLTDFLFFAIFFQAAVRYNLGVLKNTLLLGASFIIAIISAIFTSTGLPVLPFMAVLFVGGNFSRLELKREEIKQVVIFVIIILVVFAIVTLKLSR
jgi:hypothetical protein